MLIERVLAFNRFGDACVDVFDGLERALAQKALGVAIAKFHGFVFAGGCARGHRCAAHAAVYQIDIGFDGGVASRIENLTSNYFDNFHVVCSVPKKARICGARTPHSDRAARSDVERWG